ncbi:nucleotidyltransferase family protein [Pelobacter propionicus]|uniref:DNA polymerase, beta domain protein region n=1 Tax=Pelobacter propionicus (strain DSM 2379 / NBRC 103807 / OttBd1) TaxID=338966 RepID=A1AUF9_PELPD|nr:nucleotidyltransferase domain-containing protein [Pelobacter propionicus]ABL00980.1 DNA polymerase, beta domain protein region [Pelobacter propionicus DSM 2379]
MRLSIEEITAIRETVHALDNEARVYLFGSRTDNTKRGGDIDLLVMSQKLTRGDAGKIRWRLWELLGEQKIDIVIAADTTDPFVRVALNEGVLL